MSNVLLTTIDNPYNPHTDWELWYAYDEQQGHHTCGLLARFVDPDESISHALEDDAIEKAMAYLVANPFFPNLMLVYPETKTQPI